MEHLEYLIKKHINLTDTAHKFGPMLVELARSGDLKALEVQLENRQRLINLIQFFQEKIESELQTLNTQELTETLIGELKDWESGFQVSITQIASYDQQIEIILEGIKGETTSEISQVSQTLEKFKGYNLSNVKR